MQEDIYNDQVDETFGNVKSDLIGRDEDQVNDQNEEPEFKRMNTGNHIETFYDPNKWMGGNHHYPNFTIPIENNDDFNTSDIIFHIKNWSRFLNGNPILFFCNLQEAPTEATKVKIYDLSKLIENYILNEKEPVDFIFIIRGIWDPSYLHFLRLPTKISISSNMTDINSNVEYLKISMEEATDLDPNRFQSASNLEIVLAHLKNKENIKIV